MVMQMAARKIDGRRSRKSVGRSRHRRLPFGFVGWPSTFGSGEQRVKALRGVDWDVYTGQMTLIVGPSGCGKTTLAVGHRRHPQRR